MALRVFADATPGQVQRLARTLIAARVFPDEDTLWGAYRERPWVIQVSRRGDVAVVERWRDHLDLLGVEALWCPAREVTRAARQLDSLAVSHGFTGIVSPPVLEDDLAAYDGSGLTLVAMLETLALTLDHTQATAGVPDVALRQACEADLPVIHALDGRCFAPFWHYDLRILARFCAAGSLAVAERGDRCVGYTLCTVDRDSAVLGRLCVDADERRQGIGTMLISAAAVRARTAGARHMTLSTQEDNERALALYRAAGFRPTGRRYGFLMTG